MIPKGTGFLKCSVYSIFNWFIDSRVYADYTYFDPNGLLHNVCIFTYIIMQSSKHLIFLSPTQIYSEIKLYLGRWHALY